MNGFRFEGTRYDCSSKLGFLEASSTFALAHKDLGTRFTVSLSRIRCQAMAAE